MPATYPNKLVSLARETTATPGTGTVTLGGAVFGCLTFALAGVADGDVVSYGIRDGANSEVGYGTYTAATKQLTRNVISSTNANAAISLSGAAEVFATPLPGDVSIPAPDLFVLSLISGVASSQSDVAGATALYVTPSGCNLISIFDGTTWITRASAEITLSLDATAHTTNTNFDVFMAYSGGAVVAGTGPAWSSATARGTGAGTTELENYQGRLVNKNIITLRNGATTYASIPARQARLVGSIRTTSAGQTEDSGTKRFVSNVLVPQLQALRKQVSTASWTYSLAAFRQFNADANNQVAWMQSVAGHMLRVSAVGYATNSTTSGTGVAVGIGIDATTVNSALLFAFRTVSSADGDDMKADYAGDPGIGYHYAAALEYGSGTADTQTWFGTAGTSILQTGLVGEVLH